MYTWNEIYENAIDKACGSSELRAKDEARFQVRNLTIDLGVPPLDESEVPEDVVEDYFKSLNIKFDECGNIVSLELPHWIEDIIYKRKDDAYLEKDLNATAQSLLALILKSLMNRCSRWFQCIAIMRIAMLQLTILLKIQSKEH